MEMTDALQDLFNKIQKSIDEANTKQTNEIKQQMKTEIEEVKDIIKEEACKRNALQDDYDQLKQKYEKLEKSIRKNNIIIFGIATKTEESLVNLIVNKLNHLLQVNLTINDINDTYTIGREKENRPVIVKFVSYIKKIEVLKNCSKLKDTGVYISEELSPEEREKKKILRKHLKQARIHKLNAYIKGNKLYINDEIYTAEQLKDSEEYIELEEKEQETEEKEIAESSKRNNSAPATPNVRKTSEDENAEDHISESISKKRKITVPTYFGRSSARLQNKDGKYILRKHRIITS